MQVYTINQEISEVKVDKSLPFFYIHSNIKHGAFKDNVNYYSIKTVLNKNERYWIEKDSYLLQPNQYLLVNPKQETKTIIQSSVDVHGLCLFIEPSLVNNIMNNVIQSNEKLIEDAIQQQYEFIDGLYNNTHDDFGQFYDRFISGKQDYQFSYDEMITVVEELVLSQIKKCNLKIKVEAVKSATKKELYKRINASLELINDSFNQKLSVKEIATLVGMSEYHFFRTFRQVTGKTPNSYLSFIRMEAAKKMLRQGMPISEVSTAVGIDDMPCFSKLFKKVTGYTPKQFSRI
jgi:AraC family transcriptional regulator